MSQIHQAFTAGTIGAILHLTGNVGGPVGPDGAGNVNIVGANPITVTGNPGTNTLTISIATATTAQIGATTLATDAETIGGIVNNHAVTPTSLKAKLGVQTVDSIPYGNGTTNAFNWVGPLTNGQLIIGSTGAAPVAATLTAGNNIGIANAAGTVTINVNGTTDHAVQVGNATNSLTSLVVGTNGQVLIAATGAAPAFASVTAGNNIGITPGANTLAIAVNGTTQHAVQIGNATNSLSSLAVGTTGQILMAATTADPGWTTATYPATSAQGDLIYSSALNTIGTLTKDANATRYLSNTGAGNNPAWAQVDVSNGITGIVTTTNGGTGVSAPAAHTLPVAEGAAAMTFLGPLTNGQLLIGSTGADPAVASISAGAGISVTPGAGSITITATGAVGGLVWTVITADQGAVASNGYLCNKAGLLTLTLPAVSVVGDYIRVAGMNTALGWRVAQNAGNTIYFNSATTTPGAGGYLASSAIYDSVELVCITANALWLVVGSTGNITYI